MDAIQIAEVLRVPELCHHRARHLCQCGHDESRHAPEPAPHPRGRHVDIALDSLSHAMPYASSRHRGCAALSGPSRMMRTACACAFSRQRVVEMFPQPAWVVGADYAIDVGIGLEPMPSDAAIAAVKVTAWQGERQIAITPETPPLKVDGVARWHVIKLAAMLRFVVTGLDPGDALIGIALHRRLDTPPRQYKIGDRMIRINELATEYLDKLCVGVDLELQSTMEGPVADNLGAWLRSFQDELARRRAVTAATEA